ncbi:MULTISPECIES: hypothetical protein [unclassified Pseudomonas]|uniref:hypothetical protein n=1 Tax=unclassified Pseudomonas TaxID=196821 RepID=UPI0013024F81|nr:MULTISPECIES: hypothetical protein [unclassified Pseudomonas]WGV19846.1 hypothetical protein QIY50_21415 [Pseudomonas putida]
MGTLPDWSLVRPHQAEYAAGPFASCRQRQPLRRAIQGSDTLPWRNLSYTTGPSPTVT